MVLHMRFLENPSTIIYNTLEKQHPFSRPFSTEEKYVVNAQKRPPDHTSVNYKLGKECPKTKKGIIWKDIITKLSQKIIL